jgi:DNA damage-binding protein 1
VIRKGADFEELAVIDGLLNITGIWPIRALFEDESVLHTVVFIVPDP